MFPNPLHLFFPHSNNNYKAKVLHRNSLVVLIGLFIMAQASISLLKDLRPGVLGYAAFINPQKVIELTNLERQKIGVPDVVENKLLDEAAAAKGADMIARGYWAHNTPDGKEPWVFITNAGYQYLHAGENLARDFSSPESTVNAWMNSDSHRHNLLNPLYKDIGVAVVEGKMNGVDTTLVVQMFGTTLATVPEVSAAESRSVPVVAKPTPTLKVAPDLKPAPAALSATAKLSPLDLSRVISLSFILLIIATLAFDWFIVFRRNLIRLSGKSWAHLTFFATMAIILILIKQGLVL